MYNDKGYSEVAMGYTHQNMLWGLNNDQSLKHYFLLNPDLTLQIIGKHEYADRRVVYCNAYDRCAIKDKK